MSDRLDEYKSAEELRREIAELKIRLAFQEQFEEEVKEILAECENPSADMLQVMHEKEREIQCMISRQSKERKKNHGFKTTWRTNGRKIAVMAAAAILISGTSALATVQLIRSGAFELDMKNTPQSTNMNIIQMDNLHVPEEWEGYYYPTYIPEGFEYVPKYSVGGDVMYVADNGEWMSFSEHAIGSGHSIDTENAKISYTQIHGTEAMIFESDGRSRVIWSSGKRFFVVNVKGDKGLAIRIAESVVMIR